MFDNDQYNDIYQNLGMLSKADPALHFALKTIRATHPQEAKVLARHLYVDSLTGTVGNRMAYNDFLSRHKDTGIHGSLDLNSFGAINKEHGNPKGDEALKSAFSTISEVGRKWGIKTFRVGGDEARLHAASPERAHGFAKELQDRFAKAPALPGTNHKISAAVGFGYSPEHAETALIHAKDKLGPLVAGKRQKIHPPGQEPTVFHDLFHEAPPPSWKPATGNFPKLPHEKPKSLAPSGLKFNNPLKPPKP